MSLASFLATTAAISFSGALSPGPVTAVTIGHGTHNRHAGALVAVGHAMLELPCILVLIIGLGELLRSPLAKTGVALVGGLCLVWIGLSMLRSARHTTLSVVGSARGRGPLAAGFLLSATNPYFYLWWLSVGGALMLEAQALGLVAVVLFVVVHWLCDLVWLWLLSVLSFKGSELFGTQFQTGVFVVCGLALTGFGMKFLADAASAIVG
jgi:threonine/homoserine/homoserine lactone efflux protein